MAAYVVTESQFGADLLKRVLPSASRSDVVVTVGGPGSSAISLASSLLSRRHQPVVLLLDAETASGARLQEDRIMVEDLLRAAAVRTPFRVVFAVPEIEGVLFQDPALLAAKLGVAITPEEVTVARFRPKEILANLLGRSRTVNGTRDLLGIVDDVLAGKIVQHPAIAEVEEFASRTTATMKAAS